MSDTTHTPGEWKTSHFFLNPPGVPQWHIFTTAPSDGAYIAVTCGNADAETREANAERIVLCCNAHDDLVAALKALLSDNLGPQIDDGANWDACCDMAKAALAKAGEK